jgi:type IV fimbrial biogenesis protein FimT
MSLPTIGAMVCTGAAPMPLPTSAQARARAARPHPRSPAAAGGGFSLAELLVALGIASSLIGLYGATVQSWMPRYQQRNHAAALAQAMHLARAEAIKRAQRVDLCPTVDHATCDESGRWELGWMVFADANHDGARDPDEDIVRVEGSAAHGITVRGNRPVAQYVSYVPYGHTRLVSGALQMGTFTVCIPGQDVIEVVLANGGRPRIEETSARCP